MADPLAGRIESAISTLISNAMPVGTQVLQFLDTTAAEADYIAVNAARETEDPPGTGVFRYGVTVTAHGTFAEDDLHTLEEIFDNAFAFSVALRTAGAGSFVMPEGEAVDLDLGTRTGAGLDGQHQYNFALWAQTQEVSDAA